MQVRWIQGWAVSKENVYYGLVKGLQTKDTLVVKYNDWTDSPNNASDDIDDDDKQDEQDVSIDEP